MKLPHESPSFRMVNWEKGGKRILEKIALFKQEYDSIKGITATEVMDDFRKKKKKNRACYYYLENRLTDSIVALVFYRNDYYRIMTWHPETADSKDIMDFLERWLASKGYFGKVSVSVPAAWKNAYEDSGYRERFARSCYHLDLRSDRLVTIDRTLGQATITSLKKRWNRKLLKGTAELIAISFIDSVDVKLGFIQQPGSEQVEKELRSLKKTLLLEASFVSTVNRHGEEQVSGACLITLWEGAQLVHIMAVHPRHRNRGLGTALLKHSIRALRAAGNSDLFLFVTKGNNAAKHVYEELFFKPVVEFCYLKKI